MCESIFRLPIGKGGELVDVDTCIATLVAGLNRVGIRTVASCCGHKNRPGNIALADGRELIIARDHATARQVDAAFPNIHGEPVAASKHHGQEPSDD